MEAILNKVTSNGERIAVVEKRLDKIEEDLSEVKQVTKRIESLLGELKWIGGGIVAISEAGTA